MIVLIFAIGILCRLSIAAVLDRLLAKPPHTNVTHGISAIGFDPNGDSTSDLDSRYVHMVGEALKQSPSKNSNFRTLLP
jgi:hypothetical protein